MKIVAFSYREDEYEAFKKFGDEFNLEIKFVKGRLSLNTIDEAIGYEYISILGNCDCGKDVLEKLSEYGVKCVALRSTGVNNIDLETAKKLNIKISNASYSPHCVADFTVMLMLMLVRKVNIAISQNKNNNFSLNGLRGREMHNLTVGVIGTGTIGKTVVKNIAGFGCKIIASDPYENNELKGIVEYVHIDELFKKSDIITLHMPLLKDNYHLINSETIKKMKDGVIIINTSRGELINTDDMLDSLNNKKISGAGLDVLEGEVGIFHKDCSDKKIDNKNLELLLKNENVILTQHFAFFTDQAVSDMVECGIKSIVNFKNNMNNPYEISIG